MYNLFPAAICLGEKTRTLYCYKGLFALDIDECCVICLAGAFTYEIVLWVYEITVYEIMLHKSRSAAVDKCLKIFKKKLI